MPSAMRIKVVTGAGCPMVAVSSAVITERSALIAELAPGGIARLACGDRSGAVEAVQ
jgi:hypothetical protein